MRIRFEDVAQRYDGVTLFEHLNLDIASGKFFTLLGPSGCGKTTLLRMLAGFVVPDAGRVWFGDRDVTALPVHKRGVGMVFQDYALFPDRSAAALPQRFPAANASAWPWRARSSSIRSSSSSMSRSPRST